MEMKAGMTDGPHTITKLIEIGCRKGERSGDFHAFAEIKTVERFLLRKGGIFCDEVAEDAAKILAQGGNGGIVANIESRELLGKGIAIGVDQSPLCKVVG